MLKEGTPAPDFILEDKDGNQVKLSDYRGKKIVLYFYPRDNTPGCTRQALAFKDAYEQITERGAVLIGISKDSVSSHDRFAAKHELPFLLLSDPDLEAIKGFDVWQEKKMYGKTSFGVVRSTFVINEEGVIEKVFPKANPDRNAGEIVTYLSL